MPSYTEDELASQPACWRRAAALPQSVQNLVPHTNEPIAVVGCGTSWFIAESYAHAREEGGQGWTDAFPASEFPRDRQYSRVIAISRSGTTTEVIELLKQLSATPTLLITGVAESPATEFANDVIVLDFADERSVVQTRFATTTLALLRASLGEDIGELAAQAEVALELPIDELLTADQVSFIGRGLAVGLAREAALKTREAAQFWAEAYPAMDYRHGPIAIAQPGRLVWSLGPTPDGLMDDVRLTGATFVCHDLDPLAELVIAQRFAVEAAKRRGLNPDAPRSLTRSVILR